MDADQSPQPPTNPFESTDLAFARYKAENQDGTYAQFSVANQAAFIKRGGVHPTLGIKTQKYEDFWKAGESDFNSYLRLLDVKPNQKVVDYGCGSLRLGAHFIRYLEPDCYFGMDVTCDFIDLGKSAIGEELLNEKRPQLGPINEEVLAAATDFGADLVISTACAFQIHPDEKMKFINDVKQLSAKEGCVLCFDTKIGTEPFRYRSSAYVWTLDYYREQLSPLVLLSTKKVSQHSEGGRDFEGQILLFGHGKDHVAS